MNRRLDSKIYDATIDMSVLLRKDNDAKTVDSFFRDIHEQWILLDCLNMQQIEKSFAFLETMTEDEDSNEIETLKDRGSEQVTVARGLARLELLFEAMNAHVAKRPSMLVLMRKELVLFYQMLDGLNGKPTFTQIARLAKSLDAKLIDLFVGLTAAGNRNESYQVAEMAQEIFERIDQAAVSRRWRHRVSLCPGETLKQLATYFKSSTGANELNFLGDKPAVIALTFCGSCGAEETTAKSLDQICQQRPEVTTMIGVTQDVRGGIDNARGLCGDQTKFFVFDEWPDDLNTSGPLILVLKKGRILAASVGSLSDIDRVLQQLDSDHQP